MMRRVLGWLMMVLAMACVMLAFYAWPVPLCRLCGPTDDGLMVLALCMLCGLGVCCMWAALALLTTNEP